MLDHHQNPTRLLERKMGGSDKLTMSQLDALNAVPIRVIEIRSRQDIVREFDQSGQSCIMIEGVACSTKWDAAGKRQIVAFHFSGDMPDLNSFYESTIDSTVSTMSACKVGFIRHEHLNKLVDDRTFAKALGRSVVRDSAIAREWMLNLGQREGLARTAHLLSELFVRVGSVGRVESDLVELPMSQADLADALGMSTVHMNRCIRKLTRRRLITWMTGTLCAVDRAALAKLSHFNDAYLHLRMAT